MTTAINRIKARLEKLELDHLRQVVAEQGARIEKLEIELDYWQSCAHTADIQAGMYRDMLNDANFSTHRQIGITRDGEMLVVAQ